MFFWDNHDGYFMRQFLKHAEFSFSKDLDNLEKIVIRNDEVDDLQVREAFTEDEKYELFSLLGQFDATNTTMNKEIKKQMDETFCFAQFDERTLKLIESFLVSIVKDSNGTFCKRAGKKYKMDAFLSQYYVLITKISFQLDQDFQARSYEGYFARKPVKFGFKI